MKVYLPGTVLDLDSQFYKNCRRNRKRESLPKCCLDCPLRIPMANMDKLNGNIKKIRKD